jgi:hypothetical protein
MSKRRKDKKRKQRIPEDHVDGLLIFMSRLMIAMGLPSYRIQIMKKPADKGSIAEVIYTDDRYVAQVYLAKDWMDRTEDERRDTIVHEILHLWHRPLSDWFRDDVHETANVHEFVRLERQFRAITELMVDQMALILADTHRIKEEWEEAHSGSSSAGILEKAETAD